MSSRHSRVTTSQQLIRKVQSKIHPIACHNGTEGGLEENLYTFFNLGATWGGWSTPRLGRFTHGNGLVHTIYRAGLALGAVW